MPFQTLDDIAGLSVPVSRLVFIGQEQFELLGGVRSEFILGRAPRCHIFLAAPGVSREHARVAYEDKDWVLTDNNSRNGVWVNSVHVSQRVLKHNDDISIGNVRLRFEVPANPGEELKWLHQGAARGAPLAMIVLGLRTLHGIGIAPNAPEAAKLFRLAAAKGEGEGHYQLGRLYENSCGVAGGVAGDDAAEPPPPALSDPPWKPS